MQQYRKNLGKVSLTAEGAWKLNKEFEVLSIVYDEHTQHGFISKKDVPVGVDLYNAEYWMPLNVSGYIDSNIIILNDKTSEANIKSYTLKEAINSVATVGRKPGAMIAFYNENTDRLDIGGRWEIWQYNAVDNSNWENVECWQSLYYNYNKFVGWYRSEELLKANNPFPEIGCYAFVGTQLNEATIYRCDRKYVWEDTAQHAWDYVKVIVDGNVTVGENGNWFNNGVDTNIPASIKGENGKTPLFRNNNNVIEVSYDNVEWNPISDEIAAWFRWQSEGGQQVNLVGKIQITRNGVTWTDLSGQFVNNLRISRYIGVDESLPTSGIVEGTIYAKGPTYSDEDISHANPIYRLWVYAWKGNTLAWVDNGEFQSIVAGVTQETGDSETEVMSQKAVTTKLSELGSEVFNVKSAISYTGENKTLEGTSSIGYINPDSNKITILTSGNRSIWYEKCVKGATYTINIPKTTDFGLVVAFTKNVESGVAVENYVDIENGISYIGDVESPIDGYIVISYITSNGEPSVKQTIINSSVKKLEPLIGLNEKLYNKKESVAYSNEIDKQGDTLYSYVNIGLIHKGATNGKFKYIDLTLNHTSSDASEVGSLIVKRGTSISANGGTVIKRTDNLSNEIFPESGVYTIELDDYIELADSEYLWVYYTGRVTIGSWLGNNSDGTRIGMYFKGNINTYRYSSSMKLYDKKGDIILLQEKVEELEKQQGGGSNNDNNSEGILRDVEYDILREYVMNNYGLFVSLIDGYNYIEGVLTVDGNMTSTSIVPLDKKSDICIGSSGYSYIVFFDKDFKHVETKKVTQYVVVHFNEFPSNAEYVAFSYLNKDSMNAGVFCTINTNKYTTYMYSKTKKKRGTRPVINIYLSDSESEIFEKLVDALLTRDCDVIFEKGEYNFSQIYIDMADVYRFGKIQGSYQRELPLGGNCHYYLNGSVITGIKPESISDCKVFGTIRTGGEDYCIQDGTIISDGMVYCIHDEGQGNELFHRHEYKFLSMKITNGGTRPFGAGIGNGEIIIDRCIIENNSKDITDVAVHGVTSETEVKFNPLVSITNCYLKNGAQINVASENQKGKVLYSSNSSTKAVDVTDWELYAWNNEVRN